MPYTDSASVEASLSLTGVWLHDPSDAEATAYGYAYGRANREQSVDAGGTGTLYAGRAYQVYEFGEHTEEALSVAVHVANGPTHAADVALLEASERSARTLWLRDNRGRSFAGVMQGFKISDQTWGSVVSFTFARVHYAVEEVEV
jgi:hypothetical protein